MAEPTTSVIPAAATTIWISLLSLIHFDLMVAGLVGGIAAILTMEVMTVKERLSSITVAVMVAGLIGPLIVNAAPRAFPEILKSSDGASLRVAVGFVLGALAYKVLMPALIKRSKRKLLGKKFYQGDDDHES